MAFSPCLDFSPPADTEQANPPDAAGRQATLTREENGPKRHVPDKSQRGHQGGFSFSSSLVNLHGPPGCVSMSQPPGLPFPPSEHPLRDSSQLVFPAGFNPPTTEPPRHTLVISAFSLSAATRPRNAILTNRCVILGE